MTVLVVTGANGFVGTHVAAAAAAAGAAVHAVGREPTPAPALAPHISHYYCADLEQEWPHTAAPDAIVHLAGLAAVGPSFSRPQTYLSVNSGIVTTMCETLIARGATPRLVVVSTGAVYANREGGEALDERAATIPSSPYAVAKLLVEQQAAYYATRGLDTVVMRPFNHIGPGQGAGFIVPDLARALRDLPEGEALTAGNLGARRDYTDVRDVARAYTMVALGEPAEHPLYNVASGAAHSGHEVLTVLAEAMGREVPEVRIDPARLRPNDAARIVGDATRLREDYGWQPLIDWRQSIRDYIRSS